MSDPTSSTEPREMPDSFYDEPLQPTWRDLFKRSYWSWGDGSNVWDYCPGCQRPFHTYPGPIWLWNLVLGPHVATPLRWRHVRKCMANRGTG